MLGSPSAHRSASGPEQDCVGGGVTVAGTACPGWRHTSHGFPETRPAHGDAGWGWRVDPVFTCGHAGLHGTSERCDKRLELVINWVKFHRQLTSRVWGWWDHAEPRGPAHTQPMGPTDTGGVRGGQGALVLGWQGLLRREDVNLGLTVCTRHPTWVPRPGSF